MPHSYVSSIFHVVFSTKERAPLVRADLQSRLWNYLAAISRNLGIHVLAVGGTENHVHILMLLPTDTKLSDAVRTLKANSSRWIRETVSSFAWQEGYGAFSVSPSHLDGVTHYIGNQRAHHAKRSYEQEFLSMLQAANISHEPAEVFG
jgi:REP element-mobilizing transposase RayT